MNIPWLVPPKHESTKKLTKLETQKRLQLFAEFVYYIFDSFLIPLIRFNFHVTESCSSRNHLFYFRHDVWRSLSEPTIAQMKQSMFDEIPAEDARRILASRSLGFSQIRLVPKDRGARPTMNLRRRVLKKAREGFVLGRSINYLLEPVHRILAFKRVRFCILVHRWILYLANPASEVRIVRVWKFSI